MKNLFKLLLCGLLSVTMLAGCSNNADEPTTVGGIMYKEFTEVVEGKTALEIAEALGTSETLPFMGGAIEVEPGFLSGFDNYEVTGFSKGAMFAPMMGTIPFVGYIFELEEGADVEAFKTSLKENANLRWNICTEAEEMTVENEGNMVFFLMSPTEFETEE